MIIGIAGLGLIGGSFAKAYKEAGHTVFAFDTDRSILDFAMIGGFVQEELTKDNIKDCDLVLVCIYPKAAIGFMESMGPYIGEKPVVIDCCGTKREVFAAGAQISDKYGFTYVGGHPMAGTQYSGFKYARANMYHNAPMVLVLKDHDDVMLISRIQKLLEPCGFKKFSNTTAEDHDKNRNRLRGQKNHTDEIDDFIINICDFQDKSIPRFFPDHSLPPFSEV